MNAAAGTAASPSRGGRPSREAALLLGAHILDAATELLLDQGYGATSIEAVAARAGVSKRTFYHRFADKPALVRAVVSRLVDGVRPPAGYTLGVDNDLGAGLRMLGMQLIGAALSPRILALHRLIVAESHRFPELLDAAALSGGRTEVVRLIIARLQHAVDGLGGAEAEFAAQQFLQLVVSLPQLRALGIGEAMTPEERARWVAQSVALLLGGLAGLRTAAAPAG